MRRKYNRYRRGRKNNRLLFMGFFVSIVAVVLFSYPFGESTGSADAGYDSVAAPGEVVAMEKAEAAPSEAPVEDVTVSEPIAEAAVQVASLDLQPRVEETVRQQDARLEETSVAPIPASHPAMLSPATTEGAACPAPTSPVCTSDVVKSGQTASSILNDYLNPGDIHAMAQVCKDVFALTRLRAGQPFSLYTLEDEFIRFEYEIDSEERLIVTRKDNAFTAACEPIQYDLSVHTIQGTIESSLYKAVTDAGESPELAVRLGNIFAWEVDFIRDLRVGDSFKVVVEKRHRDGEFAGYGAIEAAEFVNQGHAYQGFRFKDVDERYGYYTAEGENLRKAFLKAPLSFSRISSSFTWKRLHPILKVYRPHPGYDYAAPMGTPVMSIGNGVVTVKGWDKGGGRYIKVRHPGNYESVYMHLKGYARGLSKGDKVDQGQVIGYVGSSGLSTGPHLDFRMKRNGKYIDSRKIQNPRAESLAKELMPSFEKQVAYCQQLLHSELAQAPQDAVAADEESDS